MKPTPLLERLRWRGWRVTAQRRAVAEVLDGEHVHLTAEEIHKRSRRRLPEISLATVYNTLSELVDMGEVLEVRAAPGPARYDPNTTRPHHHLVCSVCGKLYDVHPQGLDGLRLTRAQKHAFELEGVEVTFKGRCPDCRAA